MANKVFNDNKPARHNDTTRQYPRRLDEAFGPHCNKQIGERDKPFDRQDKVVLYGSLIAIIGVLALVLWRQV